MSELPPDIELDDTDLPAQNAESEKIRRILESEDNAGATYEILRRSGGGKLAYLEGALPIEDLSNGEYKRKIAETYGAGEYKLRIRRASGALGGSIPFEVDRSVRPLAERLANGTAQGTDMVKVIESLRENKSGGDREFFLSLMQMQAQAAQQAQAQMTALLTAVMGRPERAPTPASPFPEKIFEILLNRSLGQSSGLDLEKIFSFVEKLKSLTGPGEPEGDGLDKLFSVIGELAPLILAKLPALTGTAPAPEPRNVTPLPVQNPPSKPAPAPAVPVKPEVAGETDDADEIASNYLALMCGQADAGRSPVELAAWMHSHLSPEQLAGITELFTGEDWLADLIDLHEPVQARTNWFLAVREKFMAGA